MSGRVRVVALGQPAAGDDGVGLAVLEALRRCALPAGVELAAAPEASALIAHLHGEAPVIVVDAVAAPPAGQVLELQPEDLDVRDLLPVSTHGIGVAQAIALARVLADDAPLPRVRIVAVTIARPERHRQGLSPEVAAAVPRAVELIRSLVGA